MAHPTTTPVPFTGVGTTGRRFVRDEVGHRYWVRQAEAPGSELVDLVTHQGTDYALLVELRTGCCYSVQL